MSIARELGVALLVTAVAACSGGDDDDDGGVGPGTPVFTTLDVQPAAVTVAPNATQALTATAKDQNGGNMTGLTVTYASSDQTKATVSPAGVVTGVAVGTATVTATGTVSGVGSRDAGGALGARRGARSGAAIGVTLRSAGR